MGYVSMQCEIRSSQGKQSERAEDIMFCYDKGEEKGGKVCVCVYDVYERGKSQVNQACKRKTDSKRKAGKRVDESEVTEVQGTGA